MSEPVLVMDNVVKSFRRVELEQIDVLRRINLSLAKGEMVALMAPSGAGKSTLLHIAGLLDTADAGDVVLNGEHLGQASDQKRTKARRCDVGFVYQFHHLLPEFSAVENLILPQLANGVARAEAEERATRLLSEVGVGDRASHRPAELSGGQQQRVAFSRALVNGPSLLLADEPTGNLDPQTSDLVFEVMVSLVKTQNLAALIATHDPAIAKRMDRVLRLESGELVEA